MTFSYNNAIPGANNPPTNDQPGMLQNAASIFSLVAVDHVGFNTAGGGQHLQVTFNGIHVPSAPTGLNSIGFTNIGVAKPASAQLFYQNQDAVVQLSAVRAWGYFPNGATSLTQSYNVVSTSQSGFNWTVNLATGAVIGTTFCVIASAYPLPSFPNHNCIATINSTGANTFTLATSDVVTGNNAVAGGVTFVVLQI